MNLQFSAGFICLNMILDLGQISQNSDARNLIFFVKSQKSELHKIENVKDQNEMESQKVEMT